MLEMLKSSIGEVRTRVKKPAIISGIVMLAIIIVVIKQGNFGKLISDELLQVIYLYFMFGGMWYGRKIIIEGGKAPINENTGEPYYPGGFNGSVFRWIFAILIGATVGAVFFAIDIVRVIIDAIKGITKR